MAGWHHQLDGRESEWTPGVGDGQGGLACCDSWGRKELGHDWATGLNWTELRHFESYQYFTSYFLSPTYSSAVYNVSFCWNRSFESFHQLSHYWNTIFLFFRIQMHSNKLLTEATESWSQLSLLEMLLPWLLWLCIVSVLYISKYAFQAFF